MIFYLAQPYGLYTDKEQPWEYAHQWTRQLRKLGHVVFSPILHSHCYSKYIDYEEDWLAWDLSLMEGWLNDDRDIISKCPVCDSELHYYDGIGIPDTVACCAECWGQGMEDGVSDPFEHGEWKVKDLNWGYDSGLTVLLSESAFNKQYIYNQGDYIIHTLKKPDNKEGALIKLFWKSDGCRREYEFAKEHHVRVLSLEAFLDGKEVEL